MELLLLYCYLFPLASLMFSIDAVHLRSAGRWSRSLEARQPRKESPAHATGGPLRAGHNNAFGPQCVDKDDFRYDLLANKIAAISSSSAQASSYISSKPNVASSSDVVSSSSAPLSSSAPATSILPSSSSASATSYPTSSSESIVTISSFTATRMLPTDRYLGGREWYPHNGNVDLRKWVSPETPHRYISNGTCVTVKDYQKRSSAYILSNLRIAEGLRCKFYLLPDCNVENVLLMEGDLHLGGFWNATQLWRINIVSSFQCWRKQCLQPNLPIDYAADPQPIFTCTESVPSDALPYGFISKSFKQTVLAASRSSCGTGMAWGCFASGDVSKTIMTIGSTSSMIPSYSSTSTSTITKTVYKPERTD